MLSIAPLRGARARVDYLFDAGLSDAERTGQWLGSARSHAGVQALSHVDPADLLHALEGFAPGDSATLQGRRSPNRIAGWDFTFSASKSLSVAAEDDDLAAIIVPAFVASLDPTLLFIEHGVSPRHDCDAADPLAPYPIFAAAFVHRSNRWNEPHLHAHVIVPNTCMTPAGWRSIRERHIAGNTTLSNAVFQRELLRRLEPSGLQLATDPSGCVALPMVPPEVCASLSSGRAAILDFERNQPPARARKSSRPRYRTKSGKGRMVANFAVRPDKTRPPAAGRLGTLSDALRASLQASVTVLRSSLKPKPTQPPAPVPPSAPPARADVARAVASLDSGRRHTTPSDMAFGATRFRGGLLIDRLHAAGHPIAVASTAARSTWRSLRDHARSLRAILIPSGRTRRSLRNTLDREAHLAAVAAPSATTERGVQIETGTGARR